jgi:hypothetical protein
MSNTELQGIQLAAALAEEIYRRNLKDIPVKLTEIGVAAVNLGLLSGFQSASATPIDGGIYYYTARGFVGEVVQKGGLFYVVFRGTDSAESFSAGIAKALAFDALGNQTVLDSSGESDLGDWGNNLLLGSGTGAQTQLDDALALTQAAIAAAGGDKSKVVVVGQSLGGGLAGLVSAIEDVKGYAIAPTPLAKQLYAEAIKYALGSTGMTVSASFYSWDPSVQVADIANRYGDEAATNFVALRDYAFAQFNERVAANLTIHSITGEVMNDGVGSFAQYLGAQEFTTTSIKYYVGESASSTGGLADNTPISLHHPALHNLVIRTTDLSGKAFEDLLADDKALRYSLFEKLEISGPIEFDRADPTGSGFGGSGVVSSGASPGILYRALWKTVGDENGFYDNFYARFGAWLSSGAVADGKSATSLNSSVHSGVLKLGLQIVRDALDRDGQGAAVDDQGLFVFGNYGDTLPIALFT